MAHSSRVAGQGWQQEREAVGHVASTIVREVDAGLGSLSPFHSDCDHSLVDGAALIQGGSPPQLSLFWKCLHRHTWRSAF